MEFHFGIKCGIFEYCYQILNLKAFKVNPVAKPALEKPHIIPKVRSVEIDSSTKVKTTEFHILELAS
jgi:hypothetical protein